MKKSLLLLIISATIFTLFAFLFFARTPVSAQNLPSSCRPTPISIFPIEITPRPPLNPQSGCCVWEINTAIGCIPLRDNTEFIAFFLRWALGLGGGISFLLIIYAGFLYTTSSGNPEKVVAAKESFTAGASGLLLLIFSVFVLEIVIVRIFHFPSLSISTPTGACNRVPPPPPPPTPGPTEVPIPTQVPTTCISNFDVHDLDNACDWSWRTNIQERDYVYGDRFVRNYTIYSLPDYLAGNCWIRTANDSKYYHNDPLVSFNFYVGGEDVYVYVTHDIRVTEAPWLDESNGWEQQPQNMVTHEESEDTQLRTFNLWRRSYSAGETVSLGQNSTNDTDGQSMYIVIVVPR